MSLEQTITLYQPLLHTIAYNIVRCKEDAEDIVQETMLKWLSLGPKKVENTKAYLITAVRNNCLNHINALRHKKEELLTQHNIAEIINRFKESSFGHLDLEKDLAKAMKVLHLKLEPLERAIFLLKEVFDFDYDALQETFDKKKEHCRQLLCRAKKKLSEETSRMHFDLPDTSAFMENFRKACDFGNVSELISNLKQDVAEALTKKN
ncbi:MAG TPA: sigma-70 family RNA polymerase sigma factor [Chryseolinea sp.]|nr:sigma-70 family RNA polymerase sigma factor [Chryseolinea sp.]